MRKPVKRKQENEQELVIDFDGRWKVLIETLFEEFIAFFLSEIDKLIDFSIPPEFLKQDTPKILASKRKKGDLVVDNLVKVRLKSGKAKILLLHVEVQGYRYEDYGEKMWTIFYRTKDRYEVADVTSFVIYIDDRLPQNYDHYEYKFGKTKMRFDFPVYLIRNQKESDLLKSDNPFALAVLVCLKVLKIRAANKKNKKQEYLDRIAVRKELLELLNQRYEKVNYTEPVIVALVEFIMTILIVPDKMEKAFEKEFYEPFILKHQDMELSVQGKRYADMLTRAYFGRSIEETIGKWQEERRLKEEAQRLKEEAQKKLEAQQLEAQRLKEEAQKKLEAQQLEAQRLKEEAQKKLEAQQLEAQRLKEKQNHLIVSLRLEADFEVEKIAKFLDIEVTEVKATLTAYQNKAQKEK